MFDTSVSVVIPCYRCVATIERAVASVACQTLRPRELILVDDGSGDGTPEALTQLARQFGEEWIKVVLLGKNWGVSTARNKGWDLASSDYIAFLDSDDAWHPQKVEVQYTWMKMHPEATLSGHLSVLVDPQSLPVETRIGDVITARFLSTRQILLRNPFTTPTFMLQRRLNYRFDSTQRYTEDYLLLMQISTDGHRVAMLDAPMANIFKQPGRTGASSRIWRMRVGDLLNYRKLYNADRIGYIAMCSLIAWSLVKFVIMLLIGTRAHFALSSRVVGRPYS